jgi:hypothetical protein
MEFVNFIYNLLNKGFCLKVFFIENKKTKKFVYLVNSDWINDLNIYDKKFKKNKILDVCLDKNFYFKNKTPYAIEYMNPPEDCNLQELDDLDLSNNDSYKFNIIDSILNIKLDFNNYISFYNINQIEWNDVILFTYPNHQKYFNKIDKFKNKIINNYFYVREDKKVKSNSNLNILKTFNYLGIPYKNVKNDFYLNALRIKWNSIIKFYKLKTYKDINSDVFLDKLSPEEKEEFLEELKIFKNELDKDEIQTLKKFKTVKEIISYWPSILRPIPNFVYNEY